MDKVLDIGCGCNPKKDATHLLDINRLYVNGTDNVQWDCNNLPLPYPDNTFSMIYIDNMLEHLEVDTTAFLREIRRILCFRGDVIITVPNVMFWYHRLCYLLGFIPNDFYLAHKKHFTTSSLFLAMRESGLKLRPVQNKSFLKPEFSKSIIIAHGRRFE